MKRVYFPICLSLLSMNGLVAAAQDAQPATRTVVMYGGPNQILTNVSSNGKWACGAQTDGSSDPIGFIWNLESNEITTLGVNTAAYAVSDNGVVVGTFLDSEASGNGAPVEAAGYWVDGQWHHLENSNDTFTGIGSGSSAMSISADGRYIGGAIYSASGVMTPVVWKDYKLMGALGDGHTGSVQAVANDGSMFGGWAYTAQYSDTRQPVLWDVNGIKQIFPGSQINQFQGVWDFSSDCTKALWVGVMEDGDREAAVCIHDFETGTNTRVKPQSDQYFDYVVYGMSDSLTVVGFQQNDNMAAFPIYYKNGETIKLEAYLIENGADFAADGIIAERTADTEGLFNILQCVDVSKDDSTFLLQAASKDQFEIPVIVKLNANAVNPTPAGVKATAMSGLKVAKVEWGSPLLSGVAVKGYNVYRDGEKVNTELVDTTVYYDNTVAAGAEYTYSVEAEFEGGQVSAKSEGVSVAVPSDAANAPTDLYARMRGANDVLMTWSAPQTKNPVLRYFDDSQEINGGFGGGNVSFEAAVRFDKSDMQQYAGYNITSVSFCPKEEVESFAVNIYSGETLVYTQPVSQELQYGRVNSVKLDNPLAVPQDGDLYIAIEAEVASTATSSNVVGMIYDNCVPGYSDLIRRVDEGVWFYSLNDESEQKGGTSYPVIFTIGAEFQSASGSADVNNVSQYNVYRDGALVGSSDGLTYVDKAVAEGDHSYEVEAVYANGDVSGKTAVDFTAVTNTSVFRAIDNVNIDVKDVDTRTVLFSWDAPLDNDATNIQYCGETPQGGLTGSADQLYGYQARTTYLPSKLHSYGGYSVKELRFYPMAQAEFTFYVLKDGKEIVNQFVEEVVPNRWNTVVLDEPFVLDDKSTYDIILDCFDVEAKQPALAYDNNPAYSGVSDLVSYDEGETFQTLAASYGTLSSPGNWLMGMVVSDSEGQPMAVDGYQVRVNAANVTAEPISETSFTYEMGASVDPSSTCRVNVDVIYTVGGKVEGTGVFFTINDVANGIGENVINDIKITQDGDNYVRVEGDGILGIDVYSLGGSLVDSTNGNVVNVSAVQSGLYILKVKTTDGTKTYKVRVSR